MLLGEVAVGNDFKSQITKEESILLWKLLSSFLIDL